MRPVALEAGRMVPLEYRLRPVGRGGTLALKSMALALMLADHVHLVFFGRQVGWLYWLSRLVFPLLALVVAQNLQHHGASPKRYVSRLLMYGAVAQPFYAACVQATQLNVMLTLASSIVVWASVEWLKARRVSPVWRWGFALLAACAPFLEFGWAGVLTVPVFAALMRRGAWWHWLSGLALAFGIVGFTSPWPMPLAALAVWAIAARLPEQSQGRPGRWAQHAAYAFYPLHLAVITLISLRLP